MDDRTRPITEMNGREAGAPARTLYLWGSLPPEPRLAVVGARAARRTLLARIPAVAAAAVAEGFSLVSGGALGVDAAVHAAAASLGAPQLAVLPCGPDRLYPPGNAALLERVARADQSGVVFAHPPNTELSRGMFASRNGLILGLCEKVVVVQAAVPSGSLGTGQLALRRQLPVAVLPGSAGTAALVAHGATALPDDETLELAARRFLRGEPVIAAGSWPEHLVGLRALLVRRGQRGVTVDDLPDPLSGLIALTEAQTRGLVTEVAPGRYLSTLPL